MTEESEWKKMWWEIWANALGYTIEIISDKISGFTLEEYMNFNTEKDVGNIYTTTDILRGTGYMERI